MAHWKPVPKAFETRLDQIAVLLEDARRVRHTFDDLDNISQNSRAADEIHWVTTSFGTDELAMRLHRLVQVWEISAAEHLAGIAALCRAREVILAPIPLARSALEYCNRIVWILDNRGEVTAEKRLARALLEELLSAEEMCKAASHLGGKESESHQLARTERAEVRALATSIDSGAVVKGSPKECRVCGEHLVSPTESAVSFGEKWGDPMLSEGVYDALSAYPHPTLLALDLYEVVEGKPCLTTDQETVEKFVSHALIPYYQALRHHMAYNGWESSIFDAWKKTSVSRSRE